MTYREDVVEKNKNLLKGYRVYPAVVTYMKDGKQRRKTFKSKLKAKAFYDALAHKEKTVGKDFWDLSPRDAETAFSAWKRAKEAGYSLFDALSFFEAQTGTTTNTAIGEVYEAIIEMKETEPISVRYKRNFRKHVTWFVELDMDRNINLITTECIDNAVRDNIYGWSLSGQEMVKRHLSVFFGLAKKLRYCKDNPVVLLDRKKRVKVMENRFIDYVTPKEAELIMEAVVEKRPQFVPAFAMVLYNGLRFDTAIRMIKDDVHLEHKKLRIPDPIDKSYGRTMDMTEKCYYWLSRYLKGAQMPCLPCTYKGKPIKPEALNQIDFDACEEWKFQNLEAFNAPRMTVQNHLKKKEGSRWPRNGCRHAFCTHFLQITQDAGKTAFFAGNTPKMINKHYDGKLFDAKQAKEYFAVPDAGENVIKLSESKVA